MSSPLLHPSISSITPPLINSSNPWATNYADLLALYACPHTGAVTTRTSLLKGFNHTNEIHRYCFFDVNNGTAKHGEHFTRGPEDIQVVEGKVPQGLKSQIGLSSLNTLGYSPIPLEEYLGMVREIVTSQTESGKKARKPFLVSVTGTSEEIIECYSRICEAILQTPALHLAMEINLSCPNIHGRPPPAYEKDGLLEYLGAVRKAKDAALSGKKFKSSAKDEGDQPLLPAVGIKTPPYTYSGQFTMLGDALAHSATLGGCPIDFITATNTLGSSLILSTPSTDSSFSPALPSESGQGIGGMAGPALHPLALGNVASIKHALDSHESLKDSIAIIGIGGVGDADGARRMRSVGADVVGVGTALGVSGVRIFEEVVKGA